MTAELDTVSMEARKSASMLLNPTRLKIKRLAETTRNAARAVAMNGPTPIRLSLDRLSPSPIANIRKTNPK